MIIRLKPHARIESSQKHSAEAVNDLCALLSVGAVARADPRRNHFYEIEDGSRVFYIHLCPNSKVLLLAIWKRPLRPVETGALGIAFPVSA